MVFKVGGIEGSYTYPFKVGGIEGSYTLRWVE